MIFKGSTVERQLNADHYYADINIRLLYTVPHKNQLVVFPLERPALPPFRGRPALFNRDLLPRSAPILS